MTRGQGLLLLIGLSLMGLAIGAACGYAVRYPLLAVLPFFFAIGTGALLGAWFAYQAFRAARIRRTGVLVTGRVIHARSAGAVNRVPNYQVEVALGDGRIAKLQVRRWGGFHPGDPLAVMVSERYPGYAALPRVDRDF